MVMEPAWEPLLRDAGLATYEAVMACDAGEKLVKPGLGRRERIRLELSVGGGMIRTVYLKRYPEPQRALREWEGVQRVRAAGVPTMEPVAMGHGQAGAFVIVSAVPGDALSRRIDAVLAARGHDEPYMTALARALGELAGTLHAAGLAHRDFYADHIFYNAAGDAFELHLIDLARVFRPRWRQWRWRAKDLAQLRFSLPAAWVMAHWPAMQEAYESRLGGALPERVELVIERRVRRMKRRATRKAAPREEART